MIHRRYFSKLPTQANFYPMPGAAFVEDQSSRVSLLGNQALGVGSLEPGSLEIIMDRRLLQDDDRGLQQGVTDNLRTSSVFNLFVEALSSSDSEAGNRRIAFHSLPAHAASLMLHYPIITMLIDRTIQTKETYSALTASFPCNIHVVTFRTSVSSSSYESDMRPPHHTSSSTKALVLHRLAADCRSNVFYGGKCNVTAEKISPLSYFTHKPVTMREASLTALYDYGPQNVLNLRPMEVKTVLFDYV
ncbi:hypothetical protein AB6A40_005903 [Gnathostoma spinigerum]|uniref:Glycosyl hydrolase family 38 C-terminal domain-containing protein n=1 Tax=Gnathostoma spinigerum TaxID=75299 RepID=A0ABD6EM16_9BILA